MASAAKASDWLMNYIKKNVNKSNGETILKLKKACKDRRLDISSHLVYLSVIKYGVMSFVELVK